LKTQSAAQMNTDLLWVPVTEESLQRESYGY
jgi:hypothetical protein